VDGRYAGHASHQPAERDRYPYEAGSATVAQHRGYQQQQTQASSFGQYMSIPPASTGSGGKKHVCEVCGAGFSRPSELKVRSLLVFTIS